MKPTSTTAAKSKPNLATVKPQLDSPAKKLKFFNPSTPPPPDDYIYDSFMSRDDLAIWIGQRKHRKTNLILQFAASVTTGRDFLWFRFRAPRPLKVVFIDYESKSLPLSQRYNAIVKAMKLSAHETKLLSANLEIFEVRATRKSGVKVPSFPVAGEGNVPGKADAFKFWEDFVKLHPADLYIIDPLRSFHGGDENDSRIEATLTRIREHFRATVIISHHMRKAVTYGERETMTSITSDIKAWADGARGSGALTAHADLIIGQELRKDHEGIETLYFGAFMKDGADTEATVLEETAAESFYWKPTENVPAHLRLTLVALKKARTEFETHYAAVQFLVTQGIPQRTAYRHIRELTQRRFLVVGKGDRIVPLDLTNHGKSIPQIFID